MFGNYNHVMNNYGTFSGRATRAEYWYAIGTYWLLQLLCGGVDYIFNTYIVSTLFFFVHFIPFLAVWVRRMHDRGHSGWYILWMFLPLIGWILLVVASCRKSLPEANKYGPVPPQPDVSLLEKIVLFLYFFGWLAVIAGLFIWLPIMLMGLMAIVAPGTPAIPVG